MDVIYLNGPSSAGKTSLARALQSLLPGYYLHIGIDMLIEMMPEKANRWSAPEPCDGFTWQAVRLPTGDLGMRVRVGPYGSQIAGAFHAVVATLLSTGHRLIIDDVANGISEVQIWLDELRHYAICTVGVVCALDELIKREATRGDRKTGSAAEQFYRVHTGVNYDLMVDTTHHTATQCANKVVEHIKHLPLV